MKVSPRGAVTSVTGKADISGGKERRGENILEDATCRQCEMEKGLVGG